MLLTAEPVFVVAENFFCSYFFGEWLFRYLSFKRKRDGCRDPWFVFDSALVFMMVGETWIMTIVMLAMGATDGSAMGDASILRLFRLLRLSRMARMARLLRAMPELLVLIKGMFVAMRSVFFTLFLLSGILYIFGIGFVQLMKGTPSGDELFPNVPAAMNSLLLQGILPDEAAMVEQVGEDGGVYKAIVLFYIVLAGLCVMNMLVGVLCEVVSVVSSVEKESMLVGYVKSTLQHMLTYSGIDADGDFRISRKEFEELLVLPGAAKAIQEVGVDVLGLMDFTEFIFGDAEEAKELSFPDFMDMILQLRGSNTATVKEVVDLRKFIVSENQKIGNNIIKIINKAFSENGGGAPSPASGAAAVAAAAALPNLMLMPPMPPVPALPLTGMTWAESAAARLNTAAGELAAAAGDLSARQKENHKKRKADKKAKELQQINDKDAVTLLEDVA